MTSLSTEQSTLVARDLTESVTSAHVEADPESDDEGLSAIEQTAIEAFQEHFADDELELDNGSSCPADDIATSVSDDGGVWVRCWKYVPPDLIQVPVEDEDEAAA